MVGQAVTQGLRGGDSPLPGGPTAPVGLVGSEPVSSMGEMWAPPFHGAGRAAHASAPQGACGAGHFGSCNAGHEAESTAIIPHKIP